MSASQALNAIAVPAGPADGGRSVLVSVVLSPRLAGAPLLSDFPDWQDWTRRVRDGGLRVGLTVAGSSIAAEADVTALRPELWESIFGAGAQVAAYPVPGAEPPLIVSYPALATAAALARFYGGHALRGGDEVPGCCGPSATRRTASRSMPYAGPRCGPPPGGRSRTRSRRGVRSRAAAGIRPSCRPGHPLRP